MSIGFQKLNNGETTANRTLEALENMSSVLGRSDMYNEAVYLFPGKGLEPVEFSKSLNVVNPGADIFDDGFTYYGDVIASCTFKGASSQASTHSLQFEKVGSPSRFFSYKIPANSPYVCFERRFRAEFESISLSLSPAGDINDTTQIYFRGFRVRPPFFKLVSFATDRVIGYQFFNDSGAVSMPQSLAPNAILVVDNNNNVNSLKVSSLGYYVVVQFYGTSGFISSFTHDPEIFLPLPPPIKIPEGTISICMNAYEAV